MEQVLTYEDVQRRRAVVAGLVMDVVDRTASRGSENGLWRSNIRALDSAARGSVDHCR